jgi:hypothetical protein
LRRFGPFWLEVGKMCQWAEKSFSHTKIHCGYKKTTDLETVEKMSDRVRQKVYSGKKSSDP